MIQLKSVSGSRRVFSHRSPDIAAAHETKAHVAIGVDVGGTKTAVGLVSFPSCQILKKQDFPTDPSRGGDPLIEDIRREVVALAPGTDLAGIGICVAEIVDLSGRIRSDNLIQWKDVPIQERMSDLGTVTVNSDVRSPAGAEAVYGAGKEYSIFLYVTVGTGIGSCLVINREPFPGALGGAMCLGSARLIPGDPSLLEEVASGPAIVSRYNLATSASLTRAEEVLARVDDDEKARRAVVGAATALGTGVGIMVNTMDPEAVVVGGGLGSAEGLYWETAGRTIRECTWWEEAKELPIRRAAFGEDAGIVGAALDAVKAATD